MAKTIKNPSAGLVLAMLASIVAAPFALAQEGGDMRPPAFEIDLNWPTIPNDWVLGEVSSIAVDSDDDIWVLHRPRTIPEEQADRAAPPVLEFDQSGELLRSWGGAGAGHDWPEREHAIWVDAEDFVWISGNGGAYAPPGVISDDFLQKFTPDGEFVLQIGTPNASQGDADTANVYQPADQFVDEAANELYVADGYGNHRVIVFDADSGEFKRMWGAFGNVPEQPEQASDPATAPQFGLVHAVRVSHDGIVYVADRGNQRMQWFTTDGEYIGQFMFEGDDPSTPAGFAFSPDAEQEFLYVVESANARVMIFDRASMTFISQFGTRTAEPGGMDYAHHIAVDSKGNLYTAEIVNNWRAQRFNAR